MKNLLIKVSTIFKPITGLNKYVSGMGRSTFQLVDALDKISELPFNVKLYGAGLSCIHRKAYDFHFPYSYFPLPMKLGTEITKLEPFYLKHINKHDLLHIPHNYDYALTKDMNFIVTMHDTCEYDTVVKNGDKGRIERWRMAALASKKIVTCSTCSKNDIIDRFNIPEEKIKVIPWGVSSEMFHRISDYELKKALDSLNIDSPYFLAVSCSNERKNIRNLLKAFRNYCINGGGARLVLLWSNPPKPLLDDYSREINDGKICFLRYVSDNDLVSLYNGAVATMFPSRYEGFGFPILESFACGTPVMTCNNSSLPEVGGDLAVYVGEDSIDEMTQVMEMFSKEQYDFDIFEKRVAAYIDNFSWEKTAKQYVDFYDKVFCEL